MEFDVTKQRRLDPHRALASAVIMRHVEDIQSPIFWHIGYADIVNQCYNKHWFELLEISERGFLIEARDFWLNGGRRMAGTSIKRMDQQIKKYRKRLREAKDHDRKIQLQKSLQGFKAKHAKMKEVFDRVDKWVEGLI